MNSNSPNGLGSNSSSAAEPPESGEATLRLIAQLAPPDGLEKRVLTILRTTPRSGRLLSWPNILQPSEAWMRSAAAAAIVFVVAGGGWSIYMHVQPSRTTPTPPVHGGGFSSAGAVRIPETVTVPVIAKPLDAQTKVGKNMPTAAAVHHRTHAAATKKELDKAAVAASK